MFDDIKRKFDGVYGWKIKDGKVVQPQHSLPEAVKKRADYFWEMTDTYFSLDGVQSRRDIIAKLLMWCSRPIVKGQPFISENRNDAFRELANRPELTYRFIDSGFDMEVLDD